MENEKKYPLVVARIFLVLAVFLTFIIVSVSAELKRVILILILGAYLALLYYSKHIFEEKKQYGFSYFLLIGGFFIYIYLTFIACVNRV